MENLENIKPKKSKVPLILFMASIVVFCGVIIWTSLYVSSLNCTDLVYTTQQNGTVYKICDEVNINNAKNLIEYCKKMDYLEVYP